MLVLYLIENINEEENIFIKFNSNCSNFPAKQLWSLKTKQKHRTLALSLCLLSQESFLPSLLHPLPSSGHKKKKITFLLIH